MSSPLKTLKSSHTLREALVLFNHEHIHGAPVIDNGKLTGIITVSDIAKAVEKEISLKTKVADVMTSDVVEASSDTKLFEVISRFKEREIGRLIVVEDGKPVGIITQSDIIRVFPSM